MYSKFTRPHQFITVVELLCKLVVEFFSPLNPHHWDFLEFRSFETIQTTVIHHVILAVATRNLKMSVELY